MWLFLQLVNFQFSIFSVHSLFIFKPLSSNLPLFVLASELCGVVGRLILVSYLTKFYCLLQETFLFCFSFSFLFLLELKPVTVYIYCSKKSFCLICLLTNCTTVFFWGGYARQTLFCCKKHCMFFIMDTTFLLYQTVTGSMTSSALCLTSIPCLCQHNLSQS